jgi:hypothetical protein
MTRDDIERMGAGREMNVRVAEYLFNLKDQCAGPMMMVEPHGDGGIWPACLVCDYAGWDEPTHKPVIRDYSGDIGAAWQALDYLHSKEGGWWDYRITTRREGVAGYYCWIIGNHKRYMSISDSYEAVGSTVPEAICRAILICYLAGLESGSPVGEGGGE